MAQRQAIRRLFLAGLLAVTACKTKDATGPGSTGAVSVVVSASALSVVQGGSGSIIVTVGRTGHFTGAIIITVEGLPASVTAAVNPPEIAASANSTTITITAASGAVAGNSTLTIRARGSGVADATATVTLTITASTPGGFTITLNPSPLSIQQGAQGMATATLTRTGGFEGSVLFSAAGAPPGMAVTFNPASTTGNATTITIAVAATVAANIYQITIRATAAGVAERSAVLAVTVTAAGVGNTTYRVCAGTVIFAAYQDGGDPWAAAPITNNTFTFSINSGRGAVLYVQSSAANSYSTVVHYGTQAELNAITCPALNTRTLFGSVANVGASELAYVSMGGATAALAMGTSSFTLTSVRDVASDLLASRLAQVIAGGSITQALNKGMIRRGLNPAAGSTLAVLDFNAAEAFTPVMRNVTVNNLGADVAILQVSFSTNLTSTAPSIVPFYVEVPGTASANRQYPAFGAVQASDLHIFTITALPAGVQPATIRGIVGYHRDAVDRSFTLGPAPGVVTVSTVATGPNARLRAQWMVQPEYNDLFNISYNQLEGAVNRTVALTVTPAYLGAFTAFDLTIPDMSRFTGWNPVWGLSAGVATSWTLSASGWAAAMPVVADGLTILSAIRRGTITP